MLIVLSITRSLSTLGKIPLSTGLVSFGSGSLEGWARDRGLLWKAETPRAYSEFSETVLSRGKPPPRREIETCRLSLLEGDPILLKQR